MCIFDGLNVEQEKAVRDTDGVMLILAGAGSGKTRVLTCRVANLIRKGVRPSSVLAITFTNKAAREMRERILGFGDRSASGVWMMTFHSFCVRFLRQELEFFAGVPWMVGFTHNFSIYDASDSKNMVKAIIKEYRLEGVDSSQVLRRMSLLKNELVSVEDMEDQGLVEEHDDFYFVYKEYRDRLRKSNALDFDDLLLFTAKILECSVSVRERWSSRFRYVLVDEYQDTNHAQYVIVKRLFSGNLCVVGDVDQCIYGFRGADIRNIVDFKKDFPSCKLIKLEQNYRSTKMILDAANAVIEHNSNRPSKVLWTDSGSGVKLGLYSFHNQDEESFYIVNTIDRLRRNCGYSFRDIAVLYRANVQSRSVEDAFLRAGLPYVLVGGLRFYERKEVKDILSYLRFFVNPQDTVSLVRALGYPRKGIGAKSVKDLQMMAFSDHVSLYDLFCNIGSYYVKPVLREKVLSFLSAMRSVKECGFPLDQMIRILVDTVGYKDALMKDYPDDYEDRMDNIYELVGLARAYVDEGNPATDLEGFMDKISLMTDLDRSDVDVDAVTLMTVHGAKGLEFPVVFMIGMEDGMFPHARALSDPAGLEEERRLCYVAMTRAKERLLLSYSCSRMVYGDYKDMEPSRFLKEVPDECIN